MILTVPQSNIPDGTFLLPICTNRQGLLSLLSVLQFGAFEAGYKYDENMLYAVLEALAFIDNPQDASCNTSGEGKSTLTPKTAKEICAYLGVPDYEDERHMCRHTIEDISGNTYLVVDCGCGNIRRFKLSEATTVPGTGETLPPEATTGSLPTVTGDNVTCYQQAATEYMLDRATDYAGQVYDLIAFGVDVSSDYDEYFDLAATVGDIATGGNDVDTLKEYTKNQMQSALEDATFRADMATRFPTGEINRVELLKWTNTAPWLVNNVPVKIMLNLWVSVSLLWRYREGLATIAQQCENGFEGETQAIYTTSTIDGRQVQRFKWVGPFYGATYTIPAEYVTANEILAVAIAEIGGDGGANIDVKNEPTSSSAGVYCEDVNSWGIRFWNASNEQAAQITEFMNLVYGTDYTPETPGGSGAGNRTANVIVGGGQNQYASDGATFDDGDSIGVVWIWSMVPAE